MWTIPPHTHIHTRSDPQISTSFRIFNETRRRTPYYVLMMTKHTFNFLPHQARPREETCVLLPRRGVTFHRVEPLLSKLLWSRALIWLKSSEHIFCSFLLTPRRYCSKAPYLSAINATSDGGKNISRPLLLVEKENNLRHLILLNFERDSFLSAPHKYCRGQREVGYIADDHANTNTNYRLKLRLIVCDQSIV